MSQTISIFVEGSKEYKRLEAAANLIQTELNKHCKVDNVLFDTSQNWPWTTILIESDMACFPYVQLLNPKQHAILVEGSTDEWFEVVKEIIAKETKNG